jgi:hypothetical protein
MTNDLYHTPLVKDSWIFQNIKDNVQDKHMSNVIN